MIAGQCSGVNKCGNIRTCQRCARLRQRDIANAAEALERQHGQLTFTRLTPETNTQDEIRRLRASFIRRALAPAGIWTVETGTEFAGLHINILSPKPAPAKHRNCSSYSELVRCTSREAAAYIAKQSGMPPVEQYSGNLYGAFGQLFNYLTDNRAYPTVQAAAFEVSMSPPPGKLQHMEAEEMRSTPGNDKENWICRNDLFNPNRPQGYDPKNPEGSNPPWQRREKTKEERAAIMRRHLPNLYAALDPAKQFINRQAPAAPADTFQHADDCDIPGAWPEGKE